MIPPKLALFLNFIVTTLSALLALGSAVFAHAGWGLLFGSAVCFSGAAYKVE